MHNVRGNKGSWDLLQKDSTPSVASYFDLSSFRNPAQQPDISFHFSQHFNNSLMKDKQASSL